MEAETAETSTSTGSLMPGLIEIYIKSKEFLDLTPMEVRCFLNTINLGGVDEFKLYKAIITWGKVKSKNPEPDWRVLKKIVDEKDLMSQIRIPMLTKNQWDEISMSKEAPLLPLTIAQKTTFDEYFDASTSNSRRQEMRKFPDMVQFNFEPRMSNQRQQTQAEALSLIKIIEVYIKSKEFLSLTPKEVLRFLTTINLRGVDEFKIYKAVITWGKVKSKNPEPDWRVLKKIVDEKDLMSHIRIGLLTKNQWDEISMSKEAPLLPLTIAQKTTFDEYFDASTSNSRRQEMRKFPDMVQFNFEPRMSNQRQQTQAEAPSLSIPFGSSSVTPIRKKTRNTTMIANVLIDEGRLPDQTVQESTLHTCPEDVVITNEIKGKKRTATNKGTNQSACTSLPTANKQSKRSDRPLPSTSTQRRVNEELDNQVASTSQANISSQGMDANRSVSTSETLQFVTTESKFYDYMQNLDHQVKTISVEFVVEDYLEGVDLNCIPQKFPNLQELHLKFKFKQANPDANELPERFKLYVQENIDQEIYLYPIRKRGDFLYSTLWNSNVNLSLEFHGCVIIKMDHARKVLVINGPKNVEAILMGLNTVPLKSLALGCCQLTNQLNFKEVEKLTLYGVKGTTKVNDILLKCPSLVELSLWKNEDSLEPVNLSNFQNPEKLKWLALCKTYITAPLNPKKVFSNLENLHLNNSTHSIGLVTSFAKTFPNIKKLSIGGLNNADGYGISVEFLVSVLQIRSLEWVRVGNLDWNHPKNVGKSLTKFKQLTALKNEKFTSFILTKRQGSPVWGMKVLDDKENPDIEVPGGYHNTMDEQEFEFYKLHNFYNKFSDTYPTWLTYGHFGSIN